MGVLPKVLGSRVVAALVKMTGALGATASYT